MSLFEKWKWNFSRRRFIPSNINWKLLHICKYGLSTWTQMFCRKWAEAKLGKEHKWLLAIASQVHPEKTKVPLEVFSCSAKAGNADYQGSLNSGRLASYKSAELTKVTLDAIDQMISFHICIFLVIIHVRSSLFKFLCVWWKAVSSTSIKS